MLPTTRVITARTKSSDKSFARPERGRGSWAAGARPGFVGGGSGAGFVGGEGGQTVGAAFEPVIRLGGTGVSFFSALKSCVAWAWSQSTATPAFEVW